MKSAPEEDITFKEPIQKAVLVVLKDSTIAWCNMRWPSCYFRIPKLWLSESYTHLLFLFPAISAGNHQPFNWHSYSQWLIFKFLPWALLQVLDFTVVVSPPVLTLITWHILDHSHDSMKFALILKKFPFRVLATRFILMFYRVLISF